MNLIMDILTESWGLLEEASIYVLFGLLVAGMLHIFLRAGTVARHLGRGKFRSVFKASLLGIPIPLCSCGVLPAAASLKKQGANNGATTAFLISTPESGVDSVALTYALLDPVMTLARPAAAFATATAAGLSENLLGREAGDRRALPDLSCPVDRCCDGQDCPPETHNSHHTFKERLYAGVLYAFKDLWNDMALWFLVGILLAGLIATVVPQDWMSRHLGGGLPSMLIMLAAGIPLYICATASTPIAAALILKGVSPGAALVFLLVGPATNVTSMTVLLKILGRRAMAIYLSAIALCALLSGLALDRLYAALGLSAQAMAGQAAEWIPHWVQLAGGILLLALSAKPLYDWVRRRAPWVGGRAAGAVCCASESPSPQGEIPLSASCTGPT